MPEVQKDERSEKLSMDMLVMGILKEHKKERRWIYGLRFLRTIGFLVASTVALVLALKPNILPWEHVSSKDSHVAVISIKGVLEANAPASLDALANAIKAAFDSENSEAVIFRINSPGGSPVQADLLYEEIMAKRSTYPAKPVYAVIEDMGVSGGYYVAMAAQEVYANQASLVGSIGVISSGFGFTGLMEKLGIERRSMTAGVNKALLDPFSPITDQHRKLWEGLLSDTHNQFIALVKNARGSKLREEQEPSLFSGSVWNGERAKDLGLIDGIHSVASVARDIVGQGKTIDYTPKQDAFSRFAGRLTLQALESLSSAANGLF